MSQIYEKIVQRLLFRLPAEAAHEIGLESLRVGLGTAAARNAAAMRFSTEAFGKLVRFGLTFSGPLGMAAGFDKNCRVADQLCALGFGSVEVGTVTLEPQPGNAKPRLFRLPDDKALVNRLGFNNDGAVAIAKRLAKLDRRCVVGVNIGKNKNVPVEAATENYVRCFELVQPQADYVAVNVSSPNTPELRKLQQAENLEALLGALQKRNHEMGRKPLLLKIAPDLAEGEIEAIVAICAAYKIDAIIATNTTINRDKLSTPAEELAAIGQGGLSGRPLAARSNDVISTIYRKSGGKLPIIGVGGIFTAEDAFRKIAAGACLLQAYTGFVYEGPGFARDINRGLAALLKSKGFASLDEAVGSGVI